MIGNKLRQLRRNLNISQAKLAKDLNVSSGTIGMWEIDKREPNMETLKKLAKYFNVSVNWFFDETTPITSIGKGQGPDTIFLYKDCKSLTEEDIDILKKIIKVYKSTH